MRDLVRPVATLAALAFGASAQAANFDCTWASAASGTWNGAANWASCNGASPDNSGADTYSATINAAGAAYTVTLDSAASIGQLTLDSTSATLSHTTGTLSASAIDIVNGSYNLAGGTIAGGTINTARRSLTLSRLVVTADSTLSGGVTLSGFMSVGNSSSNIALTINDGLTLDQAPGEILGVNSANNGFTTTTNGLLFNTGTLGGTGTVMLTPGANSTLRLFVNDAQTLTIGSGVTIVNNGSAGNIAVSSGSGGTIINHGTIRSANRGRTVTVNPDSFTNTGTLAAVFGSTLTLGGNWDNSAGTISLDEDSNSTVNLGGNFTTHQMGTVSRSGNVANGVINITGTLDNSGDTLFFNDTTGNINLAGGTIVGGTIDTARRSLTLSRLVVTADSTLSGGVTLSGFMSVGNSSSNIALTINDGLTLDQAPGEILGVNSANNGFTTTTNGLLFNTGTLGGTGTVMLTPGANSTLRLFVNDAQTLTIGSGVTVVNNASAGNMAVSSGSGGTIINHGTIRSTVGGRTVTVDPDSFTNTGTLAAIFGGTLTVGTNAGNLTNLAANTLSGGSWKVDAGSTMNFGTATFSTNAATIELDGPGSSFNAVNPLAANTGSFTIKNGRNFTTVGALANTGTLAVGPLSTLTANDALSNDGQVQLAGGTAHANTSFANNAASHISGFGAITNTVLNHGLVRASGGELEITGGIDGQSGTIQTDSGATLTLGADSDGDLLVNNGTLDLGTHNVTVAEDYTNANFGAGNSFNAHANVVGSGQILASGDVAQALSGEVSGSGSNYFMSFGNVHVGDVVTKNYQVANSGVTGPALRGALQTSVNGGNITDARLSGSGVTASNFGPVAAGASSANLAVTFTASSAGLLAPQSVNITSNFDNVADTTLDIVSSAAYRYAEPGALTPAPVNFGTHRVGDVVEQTLDVTNVAINDGFSERLNASFGAVTDGFTAAGSVNLLGARLGDSSAMKVTLDTATAGNKSGTAVVNFVSDGAGTSELGQTALGAQGIALSGKIYAQAVARLDNAPIDFGIVHKGDVVGARNIAIANGASGALTDVLLASVSANSAFAGSSGNLGAGLAAGGADNLSLNVALDTSAAGIFSGTALIALSSHNTDMSDLSLAPALVALNAQVNEFANPLLAKTGGDGSFELQGASVTLDFDTLAENSGSFTALLALSNDITGPADDLRFEFSGTSSNFGVNGFGAATLAAGDAHNLSVVLDTLVAGNFQDVFTLNLFSTNASGFDLRIGSLSVTLKGVVTPAAVPVPGAVWLLGSALAGLAGLRRRKARG